ncbi:MAG TPA: aldo/keto reductase [Acidimicrobiales bacterium]|jgi:aryl-alcohol dehydrogenase-like predicted oxidoreductase|nr:aldo/keto reductase [Acidimicrobiales bacterium]
MRYRQLGRSGLAVSVVGLGTNNFGRRLDLDGARLVLDAAIDSGINFVDTADSYGDQGGSETIIGQLLEGRRDQVVLATKFGSDMQGSNGPDWGARASRRYVVRAVEASLRRLRTDWIDLYQLHHPDNKTPLEETLRALDDLITAGKIRYAGSSNLAGWQVVQADWLARESHIDGFVSAQNHYSLVARQAEDELVPACAATGVSVIPFFPLASGLLTGKWRKGEEPPSGSRLAETWGKAMVERMQGSQDKVEGLREFAAQAGVEMTTVAIGWLAAQPTVGSVIAGAMAVDQVAQNASAADWRPTKDELAQIDALAPRRS